MKHIIPGIVLILVAAGCGNAELPPIELDAPGGPRLMTGAGRTPEEAYEFAYAQLSPQHFKVQVNLKDRNPNHLGAQAALQRLIEALQSMRSLVTPAFQPKFDPYLLKYRSWLREVEGDSWGGSFLSDLDQAEREVRSKFAMRNVELVADLAVAKAAPAPKPDPAPPAANTPPPPDKVELPPGSKSTPPAPAPPPVTPPAASPAMPLRLAYRAWDRAHDDLIAAYKAKRDCKAAYEDVAGALALMKPQVPAGKTGMLQIYIEYYAGIQEKTGGFKLLPDKTTENNIVDELDLAARVIRKEFNPEK